MTIAELAKREADLKEQLARVREEIASRAGEVDPPKRVTKRRSGG